MRALMAILVLAGCASDFDSPSIVAAPRVLAIIAEPPEAAPGEDILLTPLVATPHDEDVTLEWTVDLSPSALAAQAGQAIGASGEPIALAFDGREARLPGTATRAAIDALFAQLGEASPGTPEHVVRLVYEEVGLPVMVRVVLRDRDGSVLLDGFKRVFLTGRAGRTTNPPPPRFAIAGAWSSARGGDPLACAPEGDPPEVVAGEVVSLSPEPDEAWLETYPALDLEGRIIEGREEAYYSWFSTAGTFAFAVTRPPDRAVEWTAPGEPGDYPIWLVVRDGHLGASACRATVRVMADGP